MHNVNKIPIPVVAHAVGMKETYESMSFNLKADNYNAHLLCICGSLKVIGLLFFKKRVLRVFLSKGLQGSFIKCCCFYVCGAVVQ